MLTKVVQIGDSVGIVLDPELLELSGMESGGMVDVQVEPNGVLTVTPIQTGPFRKVVVPIFKKTVDSSEALKQIT
jgi:antitoxin component of MazEF toxin-antitoxin module